MTLLSIIQYIMYMYLLKDVPHMKMVRLKVQLPVRLKSKIDALGLRDTSAAGLIRHLLEKSFKGKKEASFTINQGGVP